MHKIVIEVISALVWPGARGSWFNFWVRICSITRNIIGDSSDRDINWKAFCRYRDIPCAGQNPTIETVKFSLVVNPVKLAQYW